MHSFVNVIYSIPILPTSGKFDRTKLPPVDITNSETDQEGMPTTPTEKALAPLWCEVLRLKTIDVQESFFDLGGHSLLASKLLAKVAEKFGVELSVTNLFAHSTVSVMARLLDSKLHQNAGGDAVVMEPTLDLMKEVEMHDQNMLRMDIQLRAFWRSMQYHAERWNNCRVLVTGTTGFLGSFVLRDLLLHTKTHIFCLVRELPDQNGISRIRSTLSKYGILAPSGTEPSDSQRHLEAELTSRVAALKGDVGLVNMLWFVVADVGLVNKLLWFAVGDLRLVNMLWFVIGDVGLVKKLLWLAVGDVGLVKKLLWLAVGDVALVNMWFAVGDVALVNMLWFAIGDVALVNMLWFVVGDVALVNMLWFFVGDVGLVNMMWFVIGDVGLVMKLLWFAVGDCRGW
ncbi:Linear gramicidin synthase subunit D [Lamellibrachia satsuma]|nr:Linear gramicidin synthase subunit D [Lamellibrachia satsuma]